MTEPRLWVSALTFSNGDSITLEDNETIVVVGPNNCGKSTLIKGIYTLLADPTATNTVVRRPTFSQSGTDNDLLEWLEITARKTESNPTSPEYHALGTSVSKDGALSRWRTIEGGLHQLARFFCQVVTAESRLQASNPATSIAIVSQPPNHPIHYLQIHENLEKQIGDRFRMAFGMDLLVHRNAGNNVPLYCGERPQPKQGEDRLSYSYAKAIEDLTPLSQQGDGMRGFIGVLLHTSLGHESILLIDEPEAFLHPPQARILGRMLVDAKRRSRQLFVATHSSDVLRGILDADRKTIRVIRLTRDGNTNKARVIDNKDIESFWSDPILRHSNVLDGLFHELVVICESDSDCRFYGAMLDAVATSTDSGARPHDIMFVHCSGKDRIPVVARALTQVAVPVRSILDFDALSEELLLKNLASAHGGNWDDLRSDWGLVKASIESRKPTMDAADVSRDIHQVLKSHTTGVFPDAAADSIRSILRRASPWKLAKEVGESFVPAGEPTKALNSLLLGLKSIGIHIVRKGELESFARSAGGHGPKWVNTVLARNLLSDPELEPARTFVKEVTAR